MLPELNFSHKDLEPRIDEETVKIHHSKHHQGYTNKLNLAIKKYSLSSETPIEEVLKNISLYGQSIRNNAGGFYNHSIFWTNIAPNEVNFPTKVLLESLQMNSVLKMILLNNSKILLLVALAQVGHGCLLILIKSFFYQVLLTKIIH